MSFALSRVRRVVPAIGALALTNFFENPLFLFAILATALLVPIGMALN